MMSRERKAEVNNFLGTFMDLVFGVIKILSRNVLMQLSIIALG
jgi:hypothetical protein